MSPARHETTLKSAPIPGLAPFPTTAELVHVLDTDEDEPDIESWDVALRIGDDDRTRGGNDLVAIVAAAVPVSDEPD